MKVWDHTPPEWACDVAVKLDERVENAQRNQCPSDADFIRTRMTARVLELVAQGWRGGPITPPRVRVRVGPEKNP